MERRIVAIMAADIVGYSRLMETDETGTRTRQKRILHDIIEPTIAEHHGRVVKLMGDGMLVEFISPVEAVQCGIAMQSALAEEAAHTDKNLRQIMRIGINLGDVIAEDGDLFGDGVNIAARLEQQAPAGGLCISGTVYDHLKSNVNADFVEMGETRVKNIGHPVRIYTVGGARKRRLPSLGIRPWRIWKWRRIAVAAVLLFWVVPWAYFALQDSGAPVVLSDAPSIVVMPFTNSSDDPAQDYFAAGISEDLNTDLSQVEGLTVLPPRAAYRFGKNNVSAAWAGNALGVDYLLDGSLRRVGDQVRLTVRLTEVATQEQIWVERFDRDVEDIFSIQDEISQEVVDRLPTGLARTARRYTPNVEAYDAYIRSRAQRIPPTPANLAAAKASAERAMALDPRFAGGHAALAFVTLLEAEGQEDPAARDAMNASAQALAQDAITLDPEFGPAWGSLAETHFRTGEIEAALDAARNAVAYAPTDSLMRGQLGRYLSYAGNAQEGAEHVREAMRMSPDSLPLLYFLGVALLAQGDFEGAAQTLADHQTQLSGRILPAPTSIYIAALVEAKQPEAAASEVAKLKEAYPNYSLGQALTYHRFYDDETAKRFLSALSWAGLR
ncbi:MAG: adenylate/guanylate cyclase domain-containing protein [Pseudomonadota bacterium]